MTEQDDNRAVRMQVYPLENGGWCFDASVGPTRALDPLSGMTMVGPFETRDEALREAIAWVKLRAVHTNPDGSMRKEIK